MIKRPHQQSEGLCATGTPAADGDIGTAFKKTLLRPGLRDRATTQAQALAVFSFRRRPDLKFLEWR